MFEMGLLKMAVVAAHPAGQLQALQRRRHDPAADAAPPPTREQWRQVPDHVRPMQSCVWDAVGMCQGAVVERCCLPTVEEEGRPKGSIRSC